MKPPGDTGPCESMVRLASGCDVLVHMCHYYSGTQLGAGMSGSCMGHVELAQLGAATGAKTIVLSHVTEQLDRPGIRERVLAQMSTVYSGNLIFGEDGMEIEV